MGLTLMADDRDLIIGELREGFKQVSERLKRQDDVSLVRDQQREIDKREAIESRERDKRELAAHQERLHAETLARFKLVEDKATTTFGLASVAFQWVEDRGKPLVVEVEAIKKRVSDLEKDDAVQDAESRGKKFAYGLVGGAIGVAFTAFTAMTEGLLDNIKRFFSMFGSPGQ